jgi:hypothetical protein
MEPADFRFGRSGSSAMFDLRPELVLKRTFPGHL